jgi:NADH:ubiquinone oxidoreductase subunit 6 (subunit J)
MFRSPNEQESAGGLVHKAMRDQIGCKKAFWVPILIAAVCGAISLGILSLVLSMNLIELLYDEGKQRNLRILVPVGTFLVTLICSYLFFCVILWSWNRQKLLR